MSNKAKSFFKYYFNKKCGKRQLIKLISFNQNILLDTYDSLLTFFI